MVVNARKNHTILRKGLGTAHDRHGLIEICSLSAPTTWSSPAVPATPVYYTTVNQVSLVMTRGVDVLPPLSAIDSHLFSATPEKCEKREIHLRAIGPKLRLCPVQVCSVSLIE